MKYGVIHYNAPGANLEEFLAWASESGFDCVEVAISDLWPSGEEQPENRAEAARGLLEKFKIAPSALNAANDFNVLEEDAVKFQVERMKRILGLAEIIGTKVIRTEGGAPKEAVPDDRRQEAIVGCLKRCAPFAEEKKIALAVDNHGVITNDGELLYAILKEVNHPLVGTNIDTMNYRWFGNDLETCDRYYEMMAPFTFHTHLKDGTGARGEYKGEALGEGEIHLSHAVKVLTAAGYKGPWIAEYEGSEGEGVGYRKCLAWMKANI